LRRRIEEEDRGGGSRSRIEEQDRGGSRRRIEEEDRGGSRRRIEEEDRMKELDIGHNRGSGPVADPSRKKCKK
jgi:hypothetical protein